MPVLFTVANATRHRISRQKSPVKRQTAVTNRKDDHRFRQFSMSTRVRSDAVD
jgi:hypothetical protein